MFYIKRTLILSTESLCQKFQLLPLWSLPLPWDILRSLRMPCRMAAALQRLARWNNSARRRQPDGHKPCRWGNSGVDRTGNRKDAIQTWFGIFDMVGVLASAKKTIV